MDICFIDCFDKHDKYCIYQRPFVYYIIKGKGKFKIGSDVIDVSAGDLVEIPANTEFTYKGKIQLLLIMQEKFDRAMNKLTRETDI